MNIQHGIKKPLALAVSVGLLFACSHKPSTTAAVAPTSTNFANSVSEKITANDVGALIEAAPTGAGLSSTQEVPLYNLVIIDTGNEQAMASHINDNGTVVGSIFSEKTNLGYNYCYPSGAYTAKPFIFKRNVLTLVGIDNATRCPNDNIGTLINNYDVVAGTLNGHAYTYQNGTFRDLHNDIPRPTSLYTNGTNIDPNTGSGILSISNSGRLAGYIYDGNSNQDAVIYNGSQWQVLIRGSMPELFASANGLTDTGWAIINKPGYRGWSTFSIYQNGQILNPTGFPNSPNGSLFNIGAYDINDSGHYVGRYDWLGAYINNGTSVTQLGKLNDLLEVLPMAINNNDVVVGTSTGGSTSADNRAVIYAGTTAVDLNTKVINLPLGTTLVSAEDINYNGVIVGRASVNGLYKAYMLIPKPWPTSATITGNVSGTLTGNSVDGILRGRVTASAGASFKIVVNDTETYGDQQSDGYADVNGTAIPFPSAAGEYDITFQYSTKLYSVVKVTPFQRTIVFIYGLTNPGQDMYIRGGLDHGYASTALGRTCTATNYLCSMPILHLLSTTDPKRANDKYLDWYGAEANQGAVEGSPLTWTTNKWPAEWGTKKTVAENAYGEDPQNTWGPHYWKLDMKMDCSKTANGWFELKSYISNGPGWEPSVTQAGAPYVSGNHFAKCGMRNKFERGSNAATIQPIP